MVNSESQEFFITNANSEGKVTNLQARTEKIEWEKEKCSHYSPGPVLDNENIYRQAPSPVFYDLQTGKLTPTAFDDVFKRGCSVDRESHAPLGDIYRRGFERTIAFNKANPEKQPRTFSAIAKLSSKEVREHKVEGAQSMGIYDTALENNISHAEICVVTTQPDKQAKRSIRTHLFSIATTTELTDPAGLL